MPKPINPKNIDRIPIVDEKNEISRLNTENSKLSEQNATIQKQVQDLNDTTKKLQNENSRLSQLLTDDKYILEQPVVKKMVQENQKKFDSQMKQYQLDTDNMRKEIDLLKEKLSLEKSTPLLKQEFNTFLKESITELQNDLADTEGNFTFIVREVEVEAALSTELRSGKMVYLLPTSDQLKEIDGTKLQRLTYKLSLIPKE
jgi:hypothetical protein